MPDQERSSIWKQQVELRAAQAGAQVRAVANTVQTLADDFRKEPATAIIADLTERGADAIDRAGAYLEDSEFETLIADAENYCREQPLVAAAAGLALGIGVSRLVKATAARRAVTARTGSRAEKQHAPAAAKVRRPRTKKNADAR